MASENPKPRQPQMSSPGITPNQEEGAPYPGRNPHHRAARHPPH
jgi:hypothetical protein